MDTLLVEPKYRAKDTTILVGKRAGFDCRGSVHSGRFVRNQFRRPEGSNLRQELWNDPVSFQRDLLILFLDYDCLLHFLHLHGGTEHRPQDAVRLLVVGFIVGLHF